MEKHLIKYAGMVVPRYTSYPTALQFDSTIGAEDYSTWLTQVAPGEPISLYVHIPFCQSLCWYCGCNTTVPNTYDRVTNYLQALKTEIELVAEVIDPEVKVSHLHFGGGTPSYLKPDHFEQLVTLLRNSFNFLDDAEIAVEADPRTLSKDTISAFSNSGITRVSLGVQDFDLKVQTMINRVQPKELVLECVTRLKANGIEAINFDLMYGLPGQTVETARQSALIAARMMPDRIAVFGYAHVPWFKKHQQLIAKHTLPDIEERMEQANMIALTLQDNGFIHIGFDHFSQPTDQLSIAQRKGNLRRNFQGYTADDAETLIGFGASSISTLPRGYCQNTPHLGDYSSRLENRQFATLKGVGLTDEDVLRRAAINTLMCEFTLDLGRFCLSNQRKPEALDDSLPALYELQNDGLVQIDNRLITVTPTGRQFIRNIAACLDQYLKRDNRKHSLAV